MKCIITGHTKGLGKRLYEHFISKGWNVIGISRSTGYDISRDIDKIAEISKDCDIFINNTYRDDSQLQLLLKLKNIVPKMVICGSVSRFYPDIIKTNYVHDKQKLADVCRLISINPDNKIEILHLDLSFIEQTEVDLNQPKNFTSDYIVLFDEIVSAVDFWLSNTKIRQMEFVWKLTPFVFNQLKRANEDLNPLIQLKNDVSSI